MLYQYSLVGAKNHYMGLIQTETVGYFKSGNEIDSDVSPQPYFQPDPAVQTPFSLTKTYDDPTYENGMNMAWALWVESSSNIIIFGSYSPCFHATLTLICTCTKRCWSLQLLPGEAINETKSKIPNPRLSPELQLVVLG